MSLGWLIYLANVVDKLSCAFGAIVVLEGIALAMVALILLANFSRDSLEDQLFMKWVKYWKRAFIGWIICTILAIFVPSANTIYTIIGVNLTKQVYSTVITSELGQKIYKVINQKLDDELKKDDK